MSEEYISLYGETAEWFARKKEQVEEQREGVEISNAEMVRRLLEQFDPPGGEASGTTADSRTPRR